MTEQPKKSGLSNTPARIDFNEINEPGTYVFERTGTLIRVGREALKAGHSPCLTMSNTEGVPCVRIWGDDTVPLDKARHIAANFGLPVEF